MNTRVAKVIELVGTSPTSWQDAVETALREASRTIRNISGLEITNQTVEVANDQIVGWRVSVKIAFGIDRTDES